MQTSPKVVSAERVDDIALLLAQMQRMGVAELLNSHFCAHANWQGLSLGVVATVWLSHILSQGDRRLSSVQDWAGARLATLGACLQAPDLRELDFSDDRLAQALDYLGKDDAAWEIYVYAQNATLLRVYDLKAQRVRIDSTTAKSYFGVEPEGLFQLGHSKEHRPDLAQLKISMATLDPLGLPLSTIIVSGECADDPLYVPEICKVQACLGQSGVLLRGGLQNGGIANPGLRCAQWGPLFMSAACAANACSRTARLARASVDRLGDFEWQEQRLVVHSFKHVSAKQKALNQRLERAQQEIQALNQRGRGRKRLDAEQTSAAVEAIL